MNIHNIKNNKVSYVTYQPFLQTHPELKYLCIITITKK